MQSSRRRAHDDFRWKKNARLEMRANGFATIVTGSRVVLRRKSARNLHLATPAMRHGAVVDNVHVILDRLILAEGGNLSWSAPNQNRPAEI